ncbi:MAG: hypothetical protein ACREWG_00135 [Gammaproteobacteria bacterium]
MQTQVSEQWAGHEPSIAGLLACHYGDGSVYLPAGTPEWLWRRCIEQGYVSTEGFLTRRGRELTLRGDSRAIGEVM